MARYVPDSATDGYDRGNRSFRLQQNRVDSLTIETRAIVGNALYRLQQRSVLCRPHWTIPFRAVSLTQRPAGPTLRHLGHRQPFVQIRIRLMHLGHDLIGTVSLPQKRNPFRNIDRWVALTFPGSDFQKGGSPDQQHALRLVQDIEDKITRPDRFRYSPRTCSPSESVWGGEIGRLYPCTRSDRRRRHRSDP